MIKNILKKIRNLVLKILILFPIKNTILFESNPDFNDEGYWICKKFIEEKNQKYKLAWIIQDRSLANKPKDWDIDCIYWYPKSLKEWIKKWYVLYTSSVIIDTCNFVTKKRSKQLRYYGLHGMPIKRADGYLKSIGSYDYFNTGSSFFKDYFKSVGIDKNKMVSLGMSRNDQLNKKGNIIRNHFNIHPDSKMILWMPTFRQHITHNKNVSLECDSKNQTGLPVIYTRDNIYELNNVLQQNDTYLIIKIHQSQSMDAIDIQNYSNIIVLETKNLYELKVQLYEIISEFDALITDYSSIYYDYLLLDRPIAITVDDLEQYKSKIGFVFEDFYEAIKGFYISNMDEMISFINKVVNDEESLLNITLGCKDKYNDYKDFNSSQRIYDFIIEHIN